MLKAAQVHAEEIFRCFNLEQTNTELTGARMENVNVFVRLIQKTSNANQERHMMDTIFTHLKVGILIQDYAPVKFSDPIPPGTPGNITFFGCPSVLITLF